MKNKLLTPLSFIVCLSACYGTRTFVLAPEARKQLYTLEIDGGGSRLCGVDTHPIDPLPVLGLGAMNIQVGYKSYDNGGRAFCEIERGYEYHGEVFFDLTPLHTAGVTEINTLTLTAHLSRDTSNTCERSDDPSAPVFAVTIFPSTAQFSNDDSADIYPLEATDVDLGGEMLDYRAWRTRGADDINETVGINRVTAAMGPSVIDVFETELSRSGDDWSSYSIVGTPNPDWRGERTCLTRLKDIKLVVVVPD